MENKYFTVFNVACAVFLDLQKRGHRDFWNKFRGEIGSTKWHFRITFKI